MARITAHIRQSPLNKATWQWEVHLDGDIVRVGTANHSADATFFARQAAREIEQEYFSWEEVDI